MLPGNVLEHMSRLELEFLARFGARGTPLAASVCAVLAIHRDMPGPNTFDDKSLAGACNDLRVGALKDVADVLDEICCLEKRA